MAENAELRPGRFTPGGDVLCDGCTCFGFEIPTKVAVGVTIPVMTLFSEGSLVNSLGGSGSFSSLLRRQTMSETNPPKASMRGARRSAQAGIAAIEFALIAVVFFTLLFGIIELARIMYVDSLAEASCSAAKAAANIDFRDSTALAHARRQAIFRNSSDALPDGEPITDQNIRIDCLSLARQGNGARCMRPKGRLGIPEAIGRAFLIPLILRLAIDVRSIAARYHRSATCGATTPEPNLPP